MIDKKRSLRGQAAIERTSSAAGTLRGQAAIESPSATAHSLKGQAAMEYLMTYGWAILVIVVVLAVLLFLNPFKAPETCLFQQPGFDCSESLPQVYNEGGNVYAAMNLYNKFGQTVKIHKVICTTASAGDVKEGDFSGKVPSTKNVPAGSSAKFTTGELGVIECVDASGATLGISPNTQFKGVIVVYYNYINDPDQDVHRQAVATLTTTVLEKN